MERINEILYQRISSRECKKYLVQNITSLLTKNECEKSHEFIRYVIPKSTTLDNITQEDLNLLFSHINSYIRESLGVKTPYELFVEKFGEEIAKLFDIYKIEPKDVNLTASLLY